MSDVRLASVVVGGATAPWEALGFTVVDGVVRFTNGAVECSGEGSGVLALRVVGIEPAIEVGFEVDGVRVLVGDGVAAAAAAAHPNACTELDHVVIMTPSLERTSAAVEQGLGLPLRRIRDAGLVRQAFHRFPDRGCIVEIVESDRAEHAALWGLVVIADDLDAFTATAGAELVGEPRPAVQPGRRIATVRGAAGLPCPVAVMSR